MDMAFMSMGNCDPILSDPAHFPGLIERVGSKGGVVLEHKCMTSKYRRCPLFSRGMLNVLKDLKSFQSLQVIN